MLPDQLSNVPVTTTRCDFVGGHVNVALWWVEEDMVWTGLGYEGELNEKQSRRMNWLLFIYWREREK